MKTKSFCTALMGFFLISLAVLIFAVSASAHQHISWHDHSDDAEHVAMHNGFHHYEHHS